MLKRKQKSKITLDQVGLDTETEKENLFSKFMFAPAVPCYKTSVSELETVKSPNKDIFSSDMKVLAEKSSSVNECMPEEIHNESKKNYLCPENLAEGTAKASVHSDKCTLDDDLDSDFQETHIEKKQKLKKRNEASVFTCIVCQADITHLNIEKRSVHINQCIDNQPSESSTVASSQEISIEDAFILECPLCFKHFPTTELRCTHIKKCGRSRGLSVQSVIQAIRLQERHVLERRALGLPLNNKPTKQPKKPVAKKFLVKPKSAMESDIHLAKALSLSLEQNNIQTQSSLATTNSEAVLPVAILQAPAESQKPGRTVSKKQTLKPTPLLLLRTEEERQKIILEKVNAIIASSTAPKCDVEGTKELKQDTNTAKVAFLWNLSGKAEDKSTYYAEQLLDWISPSDVEVGSKLCNLSQIAGHRIFTQLPCDYTFSCSEKSDANATDHENNQPPSLTNSLRSLIGNSWMSDVDIYTASGIVIPAHKLFLALRCQSLKSAFDDHVTNGKHVLHWENTSFDAALHFLNFIYTGSAEWKEDIIDELQQLATKYEVQDLLNILNSSCETLEMLTSGDNEEKKITDTVLDIEVSSDENDQVSLSTREQKRHFVENDSNVVSSDAKECGNANNEWISDMEVSSHEDDAKSCYKKTSVSKDIDVICIHELNTTGEFVASENMQRDKISENKDIFILNKDKSILANKEQNQSNLKFEACNTDSNSSNDSCKILKANISSNSQISFNAFKNETINAVSSKICNTPKKEIYKSPPPSVMSICSPQGILAGNIGSPLSSPRTAEKILHHSNIISPGASPYAPHKRILDEYASPKSSNSTSKIICMEDGIIPGNSSYSFDKISQKCVSSEKKLNFSRNLQCEINANNSNEDVIILDDEKSNSETKKSKNCPTLNKNYQTDDYKHMRHSPQKISPFKVSNIPSSSFYHNCNVSKRSSQDISVQHGDINYEVPDLNLTRSLLQKNYSLSPDYAEFLEHNNVFQPITNTVSPKVSVQNADLSFKRSLKQNLNDVYEVHNLSSPEILVCGSDDESDAAFDNCFKEKGPTPEKVYDCSKDVEEILGKNYFKQLEKTFEKKYRSNNESELMAGKDYVQTSTKFSENVLYSNGKQLPSLNGDQFKKHENSPGKETCTRSNIDNADQSENIFNKEKNYFPEIICCNSNSDDNRNVARNLLSSCDEKDINYKNDYLSHKVDLDKRKSISKEHRFTPVKSSNPVTVDCISDSDDEKNTIRSPIPFNSAEEIAVEDYIFYDDCMDDVPLQERILTEKLVKSPNKPFKTMLMSSPDSPWTFQTNKYQRDLNSVKITNLKSSTCSSQRSYDETPSLLSKENKANSTAVKNPSHKSDSTPSSPKSIHPKFKISDSPITPLPDYKSMMTPDIKDALRRVGVKALPRRKAIAVLSHIYNETHPWDGDCSEPSLGSAAQSSAKSSNLKTNLCLQKKRKKTNEDISDEPSKKVVKSGNPSQARKLKQKKDGLLKKISKPSNSLGAEESDGHFVRPVQICSVETKKSSPESSTSSPTKSSNSREHEYSMLMISSSELSDSSQPESKENTDLIMEYVLSNNDLYKKVLSYMPLNLVEFQQELKENGINVSVQKLMNYLDEQCITFTCPRKEEYKKKQQMRNQRFRKRMIAKISQQKNSNVS